MKKLTYTLLIVFLAGLAASTWTASASETSGQHQIGAENKAAAHEAKSKKAGKKHKKNHKKKHGEKTKA
jgi:hypothetical protein